MSTATRRLITNLVFFVHRISTIQNTMVTDTMHCSSWFGNLNNETLQQNIISFENNNNNNNNFIFNTLSVHETASMEDMIQVLVNLKFKNYRMVSLKLFWYENENFFNLSSLFKM